MQVCLTHPKLSWDIPLQKQGPRLPAYANFIGKNDRLGKSGYPRISQYKFSEMGYPRITWDKLGRLAYPGICKDKISELTYLGISKYKNPKLA